MIFKQVGRQIDWTKNVEFLIAGAQKSGTTALSRYLNSHPEIFIPNSKEVHFFDREEFFVSRPKISSYHRNFSNAPSGCLLGDATPIYMYWYSAPRRIWEYNPKMKLIVLLRNPISRAYSHWNMEFQKGGDQLAFNLAIRFEEERAKEALPLQHRIYSYVDRGFYVEQLRRVWHFFPKDQVLCLSSENLRASPVETLQQVTDFLGVTPFKNLSPLEAHSREYLSPMDNDSFDFLVDLYRFEVKALSSMLDWECDHWLEPELASQGGSSGS